jgi:hypothetical protein
VLSTLKQTLSAVGRRVSASLSNGTYGELLGRGCVLGGGWYSGQRAGAERDTNSIHELLMLMLILMLLLMLTL